MVYDLNSKANGKMNCSMNNVECYLYDDFPLISKANDWDYAVIVEVEDSQEVGRVDVVESNGEEIASLVSLLGSGHTESFHTDRANPSELMDELREYLPEHLRRKV